MALFPFPFPFPFTFTLQYCLDEHTEPSVRVRAADRAQQLAPDLPADSEQGR